MGILIDFKIHREGAAAYRARDIDNPYPEMSEMGISWHSGWLTAAGISQPEQLRERILELENHIRLLASEGY